MVKYPARAVHVVLLESGGAAKGVEKGSQFSKSLPVEDEIDVGNDGAVIGEGALLLARLFLELVVALGTFVSLGRSLLFGPGDASRDRVCRKDDFRFFSTAPFSLFSSCGLRGISGMANSG